MKKSICLFFYLMSFTLLPDHVLADDDIKQLSPMIISAPLHRKLAETVHPVNLLAGDELTMKSASTIGETLKQELGIHSMSFGSNVGQPVIRGQTGARVRVLQNSIGSLDVSGISPDHANSTEALLAERIEVLRGPATLLYGSGAIGGIVNVIDNRIPEKLPEKMLNAALEQRFNSVSDQWGTVFRHDGGLGNVAWHLDGFYRTSQNVKIPGSAINTDVMPNNIGKRGFTPNSDAETWSGTIGASWVNDWGFLGFSINRLENNYGIPPTDESVRIDLEQTRYDMKAEWHEPFNWAETLKLRLGYNVYKHIELEDGTTAGSSFNNDALEGRVELVHDVVGPIDHGVFGFQGQHRDFVSTGEEAFVPESDIVSFGFFAVEDIHLDSLSYEFGLRVEHQIIDTVTQGQVDHTPISASISALWYLNDESSISLAFTHAQRAPDVQELFSDGVHFATQSYELGDSQLKEETTYNLELNFKADYDWFNAEVNLFHNWSRDYIIPLNTGTFFNLDNQQFAANCSTDDACLPVLQISQQDARFYGFESELTVPVWNNDDIALEIALFADFVRGEFKRNDVPRMPPLRFGTQLDYHILDHISGQFRLTRAEAQKRAGANELNTGSYLLLDTSFSYQLKLGNTANLYLFVKGNNLLNQTIRNSTSFLRDVAPEPGRGAEVGIRLSF